MGGTSNAITVEGLGKKFRLMQDRNWTLKQLYLQGIEPGTKSSGRFVMSVSKSQLVKLLGLLGVMDPEKVLC